MDENEFQALIEKIANNTLRSLVFEAGVGETPNNEQINALCMKLKKNTSIEEIIFRNSLMPPTFASYVISSVVKSKCLERLSIKIKYFSIESACVLRDFLMTNRSLNELELINLDNCDKIVKIISPALINTHINKLSVINGNLTAASCEALTKALSVNDSLTDINLAKNDFDVESVEFLAALLTRQKTYYLDLSQCPKKIIDSLIDTVEAVHLKSLTINRCELTPAILNKLAQKLNNSQLEELSCSDNAISDQGASAIASMVVSSPLLSELNVQCCGFGVAGTLKLVQALSNHFAIAYLNLTGARFTAESSLLLARGLYASPHLTYLDMEDCNLDDGNAALIVSSLRQQASIVSLNMSDNYLGPKSVKSIAKLLKYNNRLTELLIKKCRLTDVLASTITESLKKNISLKLLSMRENKLGFFTIYHLSNALKYHNTLRELDLADCQVNTDEFLILLTALKYNFSVHSINFRDNSINIFNIEYPLLKAVKSNHSLYVLDIGFPPLFYSIYRKLKAYLEINQSINQILCEFRLDMSEISQKIVELIALKKAELNSISPPCLKQLLFLKCLQLASTDKLPWHQLDQVMLSSTFSDTDLQLTYAKIKSTWATKKPYARSLYWLGLFANPDGQAAPDEKRLQLSLNLH